MGRDFRYKDKLSKPNKDINKIKLLTTKEINIILLSRLKGAYAKNKYRRFRRHNRK